MELCPGLRAFRINFLCYFVVVGFRRFSHLKHKVYVHILHIIRIKTQFKCRQLLYWRQTVFFLLNFKLRHMQCTKHKHSYVWANIWLKILQETHFVTKWCKTSYLVHKCYEFNQHRTYYTVCIHITHKALYV